MFALPDITLEELDAAMDDEAGGGCGGECGCTSTSGFACACGGAEEAQQGHWSSPRRRPSSSFEVDLATCLPPPFLTGSASAASASSSTSRRCYSGAGGTSELTFDELRPEDIEGFGSGEGGDGGGGGGGGGVWESGGGVMDDEARVMAELIAAGFC